MPPRDKGIDLEERRFFESSLMGTIAGHPTASTAAMRAPFKNPFAQRDETAASKTVRNSISSPSHHRTRFRRPRRLVTRTQAPSVSHRATRSRSRMQIHLPTGLTLPSLRKEALPWISYLLLLAKQPRKRRPRPHRPSQPRHGQHLCNSPFHCPRHRIASLATGPTSSPRNALAEAPS